MKLPVLDLIVFFTLTAVNIVLGASFYFNNKTPDQFTSGGRKLPAWLVGMSIFATFVSSISFLALPGKAYMTNWNAFVFSLSIPFAAFMTVKFFIPHYRAIGNISMKVLYISSFLMGIAGIAIALSLVGVKSALDAWWSLASIFSGGMLGLFLLGFICRKARKPEAILGIIIGVLVIVWMSLSPIYFTEGRSLAFRSPFHSNLTIVFGTMAIFMVGFILTKKSRTKWK